MIKDWPRRLQRLFVGSALFFATFGTRDRKAIRSLEIGHHAFVRYALRASEELSLAIGR